MTISIAMCTYNGEEYLREQLDSFRGQERLPDELVVCDDGSKDATVSIIREFSATSPFPVNIYINPQNLGYGKNFEKAACLCGGDVIAFADQDDVWLPHKLRKIESIFHNHPDIGYLVHDAAMVSEDLQPLGYSLWEAVRFTARRQQKFLHGEALQLLLNDLLFYGLTEAFRANLKEYVFPVPVGWSHDGWLPIKLSSITRFTLIPEQLLLYRQHRAQFCGMELLSRKERINLAKKISRDRYLSRADRWGAALACLLQDEDLRHQDLLINMIKEKIAHLRFRGEIPRSIRERIPRVIKEICTGRYFRYSNGWMSIAKDLAIH